MRETAKRETPVMEVVRALLTLPPERVAEAHDFILFLRSRYGQVADASDAWIDDDIRDLAAASVRHAAETMWAGEASDDAVG
jgi:hypothetical protein